MSSKFINQEFQNVTLSPFQGKGGSKFTGFSSSSSSFSLYSSLVHARLLHSALPPTFVQCHFAIMPLWLFGHIDEFSGGQVKHIRDSAEMSKALNEQIRPEATWNHLGAESSFVENGLVCLMHKRVRGSNSIFAHLFIFCPRPHFSMYGTKKARAGFSSPPLSFPPRGRKRG